MEDKTSGKISWQERTIGKIIESEYIQEIDKLQKELDKL